MEWCPARWSVFLSLLIFPCTIKSRSSLLALAHPGGPSCGGVVVVNSTFLVVYREQMQQQKSYLSSISTSGCAASCDSSAEVSDLALLNLHKKNDSKSNTSQGSAYSVSRPHRTTT